MANCTGCECCNTLEGSISLKFNSGDPALLYRGEGLEPIRKLGLHTSHELANAHQSRKDCEVRLRLQGEQAEERERDLESRVRELESGQLRVIADNVDVSFLAYPDGGHALCQSTIVSLQRWGNSLFKEKRAAESREAALRELLVEVTQADDNQRFPDGWLVRRNAALAAVPAPDAAPNGKKP